MRNIIVVNFEQGKMEANAYDKVWQYDYGQTLRIQGLKLPRNVEIHFATQRTGGIALIRVGVTRDGVTDVVIPDSMLENGDATSDYPVYAFVYLTDEASGQTEYMIRMQIKSRPRPEIPGGSEDPGAFHEAVQEVRKLTEKATESERQAEGWAHGREDLPERAQDNAKYYAGQTAADAEKTGADRTAVESVVQDVTQMQGDVAKDLEQVQKLAGQAQTSATNAALSEQAAKTSETNAQTAQAGAETAEANAELAERNTKTSEQAVEKAKQLVAQLGQEVLDNKNHVDQTVHNFDLTTQQALADINNAGQTQTERVQSVGEAAVESVKTAQNTATKAVETAKTEAVEAVQTEGTTQTGNVTKEGEKQVRVVRDKGAEVLQSIPEDFTAQMESKLDKNQGTENAGKSLLVGEDGNVIPGEVTGGGDGIPIINTISGVSPLAIYDSAERVNKGFGLIGNTEQVQTTGAQLFDAKKVEFGKWIGSGGASITAGRNCVFKMQVKPNNVYRVNPLAISGTIAFAEFDAENVFIKQTVFNRAEYGLKCTTSELVSYVYFLIGDTIDAIKPVINDVMLYDGDVIKIYEPYTGGKPSPSPEYPQEIKNVGKWNAEKQKYEVDVKVTGKNLFDKESAKIKGNWIPRYPNNINNLMFKVYIGNAKQVTASIKNKLVNGLGFNVGIVVDEYSGTYWIYSGTNAGATTYKQVVKTEKNYVYVLVNTLAGIDEFLQTVNDFQIEIGGNETEYEPYREPQTLTLTSDRPLAKWDKLVEQDGQIGWLYGGKIAKDFSVIKKGSDESVSGKTRRRFCTNLTGKYTKSDNVLCNFLNTDVKNNDYGIAMLGEGGIYIYAFENTGIETVEQANDWLNSLKFEKIIEFENTISEFVLLPQSEQDAIRALKTYYPTTVVTVDGGRGCSECGSDLYSGYQELY